MIPGLFATLAAVVATAAPLDEASYLFWTQQPEAAARALETWLADNPDDAVAHALYLDVRAALGESGVALAEYQAWAEAAPDDEMRADLVSRAQALARSGVSATDPGGDSPEMLHKRYVKVLARRWEADPYELHRAADILWGADARLGSGADKLREAVVDIAADLLKSDDKVGLESARHVAWRAEDDAMQQAAAAKLAQVDPQAWRSAHLDADSLAQQQLRDAARAVNPAVALERVRAIHPDRDLTGAMRLREVLLSDLLAQTGRREEAVVALEKAWETDPDDANAAARFALAASAANTALDDARKAVVAGVSTTLLSRWDPRRPLNGMTWPEAYTAFYMDQRVRLGLFDRARRRLDRLQDQKSDPPGALPVAPDANWHLVRGLERKDRIGTRHLVEAVRLGEATGDDESARRARSTLAERKVWFVGGLDALVAAWNAELGAPLGLRPSAAARAPSPSRVGQAPYDLTWTVDGKTVRLSELSGVRIVATFNANGDDSPQFLRDLDAVARGISGVDLTWMALATTGDPTALLTDAGLSFPVGVVEGDVPSDWAGDSPRVLVLGPEGSVAGDSGDGPDEWRIRDTVRGAVAKITLLAVSKQAPRSISRTEPKYPDAAHWLGTPTLDCLGRAILLPSGEPFHVEVHDCPEPFITATRKALSQWRWAPRDILAEGLVNISYVDPRPPHPDLKPAACLWTASFTEAGPPIDVVSSCDEGLFTPGPIPWSEYARARDSRIDSAVGSMTIHNVDLPTACEVVLDVYRDRLDVGSDPGTCPASVRHDAVERVRHWAWSTAVGQTDPVRLVLRFAPPER